MERQRVTALWRAATALAMTRLSALRAAGLRSTVKSLLITMAVCWVILSTISMISIKLRRPACSENGFEEFGVSNRRMHRATSCHDSYC